VTGSGRLKGRVALVTGGASGIGLECARLFVAEGAAIWLIDLNDTNLKAAKEELGVSIQVADVTDEDSVRVAVDSAVREFGSLDIAVNAAGTGGFGPIIDLPLAEWQRVVNLCLTGTFVSLKHEARAMSDGGSIINVTSLNALQPAEGYAAYASAKAAVAMLTQVAAMELGPRGIRVNAVAPGLIDTPLTAAIIQSDLKDEYLENSPIARIGQTSDVASAILFFASAESTWISGEQIAVDGAAHTRRYPQLFRLLDK
jgi:NAD(P)-dependent dehydrogenase (short-subunit alcohol dehydrogenase family)